MKNRLVRMWLAIFTMAFSLLAVQYIRTSTDFRYAKSADEPNIYNETELVSASATGEKNQEEPEGALGIISSLTQLLPLPSTIVAESSPTDLQTDQEAVPTVAPVSTTIADDNVSRGAVNRSNSNLSGGLNVCDYGAVGNGLNNDTSAIQAAIDRVAAKGGGTVTIPAGTFLVDPVTMIKVKSNVTIRMTDKTILKAMANGAGTYAVISIHNQSNVQVIGGKIIGDRDEHWGSDGEWGHGISITGCNNVRISGVSLSNCWGDGIYVGSNSVQNYSKNIVLENIYAKNNRRNGITIISAINLTIRNCVLSNSNGTRPQAGLCIEPNRRNEHLENIVIDNLTTKNNDGYGINFYINLDRKVTITVKDFADYGSKDPFNEYWENINTNDLNISFI